MCLSIYLGSMRPLEALRRVPEGGINIEVASWKPPPLENYEFVYFVGQINKTSKLGCSCVFIEYVDWESQPSKIISDNLYDENLDCVFSVLRQFCENAQKSGGVCSLVTDDSNGLKQACEKDDYHNLFLKTKLLERHNLIFSGVDISPYRHFTVIK